MAVTLTQQSQGDPDKIQPGKQTPLYVFPEGELKQEIGCTGDGNPGKAKQDPEMMSDYSYLSPPPGLEEQQGGAWTTWRKLGPSTANR